MMNTLVCSVGIYCSVTALAGLRIGYKLIRVHKQAMNLRMPEAIALNTVILDNLKTLNTNNINAIPPILAVAFPAFVPYLVYTRDFNSLRAAYDLLKM